MQRIEVPLALDNILLEGMTLTDLRIFSDKSGSVMHAIKSTELTFTKFGEVYFSTVEENHIKAWKLHKKMTLNLIVPCGQILFCFLDLRKDSKTYNRTYKIILSQEPYIRLTVPPKIWFGFKGANKGLNLICNVADIIHDPNEILRKDIDKIDMDWSLK